MRQNNTHLQENTPEDGAAVSNVARAPVPAPRRHGKLAAIVLFLLLFTATFVWVTFLGWILLRLAGLL